MLGPAVEFVLYLGGREISRDLAASRRPRIHAYTYAQTLRQRPLHAVADFVPPDTSRIRIQATRKHARTTEPGKSRNSYGQ